MRPKVSSTQTPGILLTERFRSNTTKTFFLCATPKRKQVFYHSANAAVKETFNKNASSNLLGDFLHSQNLQLPLLFYQTKRATSVSQRREQNLCSDVTLEGVERDCGFLIQFDSGTPYTQRVSLGIYLAALIEI